MPITQNLTLLRCLTPLAPTLVSHIQTFTSSLESFLWGWRKPDFPEQPPWTPSTAEGKKDRAALKELPQCISCISSFRGRRMFGLASRVLLDLPLAFHLVCLNPSYTAIPFAFRPAWSPPPPAPPHAPPSLPPYLIFLSL